MRMDFDFDRPVSRIGTHCVKWDMLEARYGVAPEGAVAMWVADMDFAAPPPVTRAVEAMARHGVYGYFGDDRRVRAAVTGWMARRHGWMIDPDWIVPTNGLVAAVAHSLQAHTQPGDGVILFTPVYHAFHRIVAANGRRVVESPLTVSGGRARMDLDALAGQMNGTERMVILCSPHNPGGWVWDAAELAGLADFCAARGLVLVSDEVHHDLVMPGNRHVATALAAPDHAARMVTLVAASKTFNLAGGMTGFAVIPDAGMRRDFVAALGAAGSSPNIFGMAMTTAAYEEGEPWLAALLAYLDGNRQVFDAAVNAIPGVRSTPLQATYLAWVDFTGTGLSEADLVARVQAGARVVTNHGSTFGSGGAGFLRFNLAMPRAQVAEAVARVAGAFADLQ
jgi:cystathionine beta-lyase